MPLPFTNLYRRVSAYFTRAKLKSKALSEARSFLVNKVSLRQQGTVRWRFLTEGEVNLYWSNDDFLVDMAFFGDGLYSYYYMDKHTGADGWGDVAVDRDVPALVRFLTLRNPGGSV